MDRDMRMTGVFRAQSDNPEAPLGFELNNPWKVCYGENTIQVCALTVVADGGPNFVNRYPQLELGSAKSCTDPSWRRRRNDISTPFTIRMRAHTPFHSHATLRHYFLVIL